MLHDGYRKTRKRQQFSLVRLRTGNLSAWNHQADGILTRRFTQHLDATSSHPHNDSNPCPDRDNCCNHSHGSELLLALLQPDPRSLGLVSLQQHPSKRRWSATLLPGELAMRPRFDLPGRQQLLRRRLYGRNVRRCGLSHILQ